MDGIGTSNQRLLDLVEKRRKLHLENPKIIFPWRRPCVVKALLVTDGGLDFGAGDFGLSTLVDVLLNDDRSYVRFDLTLAHLRTGVSDAQVMQGAPRVSRSIKGFVFDDPNHFKLDAFDEVWLFGIETNFHATFGNGAAPYPNRRANAARYPANRLGDGELRALTAHMNRGGGVFATGDHGSLGAALCGSLDRVRSMRHWQDFGASAGGEGQVGMQSSLRNDSNQTGHDAGSQFSDQSDDVPQRLDLKLYSTHAGILREARYPHPVLCSRLGRIDVFPDHPHEGECRTPASLAGASRDGSDEYPNATDGSGRVSPEVVAWGRVPAGNRAASRNNVNLKQATQAHRFGVVSTYDGHRCKVGRVVCDSTWHHFVNVNLIGVVEGAGFDDFPFTPGTHASKHDGFLSSPAGRAALDKIREYFVNVGVWIAPTERHACMNSRLWWELIWSDRLVEATLLRPDLVLEKIDLQDLYHIGIHARDVLGRLAGACQSIHFVIPELERIHVELVPWIDPWAPWPAQRTETDPPLPWFDPQPLVDLALGGALVALRHAYPYPTEDVEKLDEDALKVARRGAVASLRRALDQFGRDMQVFGQLLAAGRKATEPPTSRAS